MFLNCSLSSLLRQINKMMALLSLKKNIHIGKKKSRVTVSFNWSNVTINSLVTVSITAQNVNIKYRLTVSLTGQNVGWSTLTGQM